MIEIAARILFAITCAFFGTMLPTIPLWGNLKIVNPFWDIVYGLGLFVGGFFPGGLRSTPSLFLGVIFWLPFVTIVIFWISGIVLHMKPGASRNVWFVVIAITFLFNIDRSVIQKEPYYRLPFFTNFIAVIY